MSAPDSLDRFVLGCLQDLTEEQRFGFVYRLSMAATAARGARREQAPSRRRPRPLADPRGRNVLRFRRAES